MKITFEADTLPDLIHQIAEFTNDIAAVQAAPLDEKPKVEAPKPVVEAKPVEKPKNKGGRPKGYSPKKNGVAVAAKTAPKTKAKAPEPKGLSFEMEEPDEAPPLSSKGVNFEDLELPQPEPEQLTPTQLAAIRVKTTEELQQAYAGGKHKQVLELLRKHGNGAKSFRELHIEDFVPIRKAIDDGALA